MEVLLLVARLVLATVFAAAGIAKLLDLPGSRAAVVAFGVPQRFASLAGVALPGAELAIALLLLPTTTARWGAVGALLLLATFIVAIGFNLLRGRAPDCHCFGQLHSAPAGAATLRRNALLAGLATFIAIAGPSDAGDSLANAFTQLSAVDDWQLVGVLLLLGLVVGPVQVSARMRARQGRLPGRTKEVDPPDGKHPTTPLRRPASSDGLPVGTPAPTFTLPDLSGNPVSLADVRADHQRVLLLFTDPNCGPCQVVMPLVSQWQAVAGQRLHIEVISRGDRTANITKAREHDLARVLLQEQREVALMYATGGTPAAVLIEEDGTIGAPVAGGYDAIRDLLASLLGEASDPSLRAPTPTLAGQAPAFRLPTLTGAEVSLAELLAPGRPLMLHFTDPRCGPCYELLPDIGGWQRVYGDQLTSVVVSSGDPDTNRLITAEYGISPGMVLMQADREVFDGFNLRQLPTAVVVEANGEIRPGMTYGAQAVRQLVADTLGLKLPDRPTSAIASVAVGDPAPVFHRPDLHGTPHEVGVPNAGRTVVLFWNPGCPHCERLLPALKAWESHPDAPNVMVVSRGPHGLNRELGLASPIVLDDDRTIARSYGATGTPAAVVIDAHGRIAAPVGRGATGVRTLIETMIGASAPPGDIAQR
jgi:methylamine dehydrogenase accessory protein MauD